MNAAKAPAAIQTLIDSYLAAYTAQDAAGCAAVYGEDARCLSSFGPPVAGRTAIAAAHREWFTYGERDKVMKITDWGAEGDLGWCEVAYSATVPQPDGRDAIEAGGSLNILARQPDGAYLILKTCLVHNPEANG